MIAQDTGLRPPAPDRRRGCSRSRRRRRASAAIEELERDYERHRAGGARDRGRAPRLRSRARLAPGAAAAVTGADRRPRAARARSAASSTGARSRALRRRPYRYATSAPLEEVTVRAEGGAEAALILKDLARERLLGDAPRGEARVPPRARAARSRPTGGILGPAGIGPRCFAAVADSAARYWLLLEKAPGVELWQVGEFAEWEDVAVWLGALPRRVRGPRGRAAGGEPVPARARLGVVSLVARAGAGGARAVGGPARAGAPRRRSSGYDEVVARARRACRGRSSTASSIPRTSS